MCQRPVTLVQQSIGEVVEGALAAMAPLTFAPGSVLVCAPASNVVALASRALQRTVFPPQGMEIGVAGVGVEELVEEERIGMAESPL